MKARLTGQSVRIFWRDEGKDWQRFRILESYKGGWLKIQGEADGDAGHNGDVLIIHVSETEDIVAI